MLDRSPGEQRFAPNPKKQQIETKPPVIETRNGLETKSEKEKRYLRDVQDFLRDIQQDPRLQEMLGNDLKQSPIESDNAYAERKKKGYLRVLKNFKNDFYHFNNQSEVTRDELLKSYNNEHGNGASKKFGVEIADKLIKNVQKKSQVTPDLKAQQDMIWFNGKTKHPEPATETRFYISATPDGAPDVAAHLGQLTDTLDKYGISFRFKFRDALQDYTRTDSCVAYLFLPEAKTEKDKAITQDWLEKIIKQISLIPDTAVKQKHTRFTKTIKNGISYAEDTRPPADKKISSYGQAVANILADSIGEYADHYKALTDEAITHISNLAIEKMKLSHIL